MTPPIPRNLRAAGFAPVVSHDFDAAHEWRLPELLGNLRSTSVLSRAALGERHQAFEAALTSALLAHDPSGRYAETVRFGYTVARKPAQDDQRTPTESSTERRKLNRDPMPSRRSGARTESRPHGPLTTAGLSGNTGCFPQRSTTLGLGANHSL